ncbi:nuclear valosin-containing protein-like protein [Carex littledalei]|uniref:Nuclear valosin-containing protein-like protein n=1 Tax=Carex littledalei TaxID=544730 RepID=A0A833W229_9POAL|nr:nuclear valosin-containing protein-like protein [Carex littledalei]
MDDSRNAPAAAKSEKKTASTVPENKGGEPGKSDTAVKKDASISKDVAPDNEFEKRIRPEVIPANEIGVTFDDIGALDDIKESLQELVMLPLRRPDLFKGGLLKPCRGILLFGPPESRGLILRTLLSKEKADDGLDFKELATITEESMYNSSIQTCKGANPKRKAQGTGVGKSCLLLHHQVQ